jgi:hypothetical protein
MMQPPPVAVQWDVNLTAALNHIGLCRNMVMIGPLLEEDICILVLWNGKVII